MKSIRLWGVKQNNLKDIDLEVPIGVFTVICGPSGSGKSSLAFETLYAEGQRRYIESLSNYSKQFLNKAPKPDIDDIENVPPSISIEQKNGVKSSRSTVGTTTEIIDYLRLLFEKVGKARCSTHDLPLEAFTPSLATDRALSLMAEQRGYIAVRIAKDDRLVDGKPLLEQLKSQGFLRYATIPPVKPKASQKITFEDSGLVQDAIGEVLEISDLAKNRFLPKEDFYLIVDRLAFRASDRGRLTDSIAQAFQISRQIKKRQTGGEIFVFSTEGKRVKFSELASCPICSETIEQLTSANFSFNSPVGACETCKGFGNILKIDEQKVIPNPELSIAQGAIKPFAMPSGAQDKKELFAFCKKMKIDLKTPWKDLDKKQQKMLWQGHGDFFGVEGLFEYLETKKYKMHVRVFLARHKSPSLCPSCKGSRLKPIADRVYLNGKTINALQKLTIDEAAKFFSTFELSPMENEIAKEPLRQLRSRLHYLQQVGVGYLTFDRPTKTLSGGEYQRIMLSNQLGLELSQTLYVLDEPTIGLHPRDNDRLIDILKKLNALGNTLVVVEHDYDVIKNADHIIEMGPGSGVFGGEIVFQGSSKDFMNSKTSLTAHYLRPETNLGPVREVLPVDPQSYKYELRLNKCSGQNLKDVDLVLPLNRLVTVTGVSGSGKSSLITNTLYPTLARHFGVEYLPSLPFASMSGEKYLKGVVMVDQAAVGKTSRSNPATYMKIFDTMRTIMANTDEAKLRGFTPGTFSLNVDGGRCPVCKGLGHEIVDMVFMDDIFIPCEACEGRRYRPEVLEITYKNKNLWEILNLTVQEAMDFFVSHPNIWKPLSILKEVGLDYIRLGQTASTLSGGESQRLKIAYELQSAQPKGTLYILDEPTTGLHFKEIYILLKILNKLVESGGSVLLIEHNLEMIRNSDHIIDLGPEAGPKGGNIVFTGTPNELLKSAKSLTGKYLKLYLDSMRAGSNNPKGSKNENYLDSTLARN